MQFSIFDEEAVEVPSEEAIVDYRAERNLARAAEFLVAYDISRGGWDCFTVGEGLRYDLIADVGGVRRVQVKMNRRAVYKVPGASRVLSYTFGGKSEKGSLRDYLPHVDLFAFVGMDRATVLYALPAQISSNALHVSATAMSPETSDLSWTSILREWGVDG